MRMCMRANKYVSGSICRTSDGDGGSRHSDKCGLTGGGESKNGQFDRTSFMDGPQEVFKKKMFS